MTVVFIYQSIYPGIEGRQAEEMDGTEAFLRYLGVPMQEK
jgi:hypothetical protein